MGSYSYLNIGKILLHSEKRSIEPQVLRLFTESDKEAFEISRQDLRPEHEFAFEMYGNPEEGDRFETAYVLRYAAKCSAVRDRLDLMGYTLKNTEAAFEATLATYLSGHYAEYNWCDEPRTRGEVAVLRRMNFGHWRAACSYILANGISRGNLETGVMEDIPTRMRSVIRFLINDASVFGLWWPEPDFKSFRHFMRAAVECEAGSENVTYDLSEYVNEFESKSLMTQDLCGWSRRELLDDYVVDNKIVILTEGRSDKTVIDGTLRLLYPHLAEAFSFIDFDGLKPMGGAPALVTTLKAFASAGIVNKIVAVFDNDTAAHAAMRGLNGIALPDNVRAIFLPRIESAAKYPTLGPTGTTTMDVNGLAGSLEMYFGKDVLTAIDGALVPVQWHGYVASEKRYQGEVGYKQVLHDKFIEKLKSCAEGSRPLIESEWSDMRAVVRSLLLAFAGS